jgi:hypothetical protein
MLWIVGELVPPEHASGHTWQFVGVFDEPQKAEAACTTPNHFYGAATLNERLEDVPKDWPDAIYPRQDRLNEWAHWIASRFKSTAKPDFLTLEQVLKMAINRAYEAGKRHQEAATAGAKAEELLSTPAE